MAVMVVSISASMNGRRDWHDLERPGRRFKRGHKSRYGTGVARIEHDAGPLESGRDLRKQLKPLAFQRGFPAGEAGDVSGRLVESCDDAGGNGIDHANEDDRDRPRLPLEGNGRRGIACHDDVGLQSDQLPRERSYPIDVTSRPTKVQSHVTAIDPTQVRKQLNERRDKRLQHGIVFDARNEHAYAPYAVALLRPRREGPSGSAAEERDELATIHSMTSSARSRIDCRTVRPSALAVLRFTAISNLVGNCTGRSPRWRHGERCLPGRLHRRASRRL